MSGSSLKLQFQGVLELSFVFLVGFEDPEAWEESNTMIEEKIKHSILYLVAGS